AEANPRHQGLPAEGSPPRCQVGEDQEQQGDPLDQVQDPLLQVPVHPVRHRQGEGRQAHAVASPRSAQEAAP
ncbi:unnamed protein product, partial [Ectocarpus fasciculatus]